MCRFPETLSVRYPDVLPLILNRTLPPLVEPLAPPLRPKFVSLQSPETLLPLAPRLPVRLMEADGLAHFKFKDRLSPPPP